MRTSDFCSCFVVITFVYLIILSCNLCSLQHTYNNSIAATKSVAMFSSLLFYMQVFGRSSKVLFSTVAKFSIDSVSIICHWELLWRYKNVVSNVFGSDTSLGPSKSSSDALEPNQNGPSLHFANESFAVASEPFVDRGSAEISIDSAVSLTSS